MTRCRSFFLLPLLFLLAGFAVSLVSPAELFRTRLQSENGKGSATGAHLYFILFYFYVLLEGVWIAKSSSSFSNTVIREIFHQTRVEGIQTLWRGLSPTLWRDVPFSGLYWLGYESFRPFFTSMLTPTGQPPSEFLVSFSSGATSGAVRFVPL